MTSLGIIVNNKARNAAALSSYLNAFDTHSIKYSLYRTEPENLETLLETVKDQYSILLVGGGDGTIRSAAQRCVYSKTILGVLPLGTLNHFSQELGLPTDPAQLINAIQLKSTKTIDVAQVNHSIFINNSSIGFYPHFAKKRNYYSRFYNKWLSYIPGFIQALRHHPAMDLAIRNKDFSYQFRTSFVMISNNLYSYEFPIQFARDSFHSAVLGMYFFKYGKLRVAKIIRYFFNRKKSFAVKQTETPIEINVTGLKEINVSLDGEVVLMNTPLRYQSLPLALTVLTSST